MLLDDDGDNMTTKTVPWEDTFDDGWSRWGTWLVEDGAAHKNAASSGGLTLGLTADDHEVTFGKTGDSNVLLDDDADNLATKVVPWEDTFEDGLIDDGWSRWGTWLVEDGAAHKNAASSGGLTLGLSADDHEVTFSYMLEDVSTEDMRFNLHLRYDDSDNRIVFLVKPSSIGVYDKDLGTLRWQSNVTVSTDAYTWYDVRVIADGDNVQFWRNARGELPTKLHDFTVYQTTSTSLKIDPHTDAPIHFDNFRVLADGMSRTTTYAYAAGGNNELQSMSDYNGTTTFTYDDWGRTETETLPSGTELTYSWTSANLLAGVDSDDVNDTDVQYLYRGDLKRFVRIVDGAWQTIYNYDAGFNVVSEEDVLGPGSTQLARTYVAGLAEIIGSNPATGTARYLTHDHLGSTRGVFDSAKASLGTFEFTPYGNPYAFTGPPDITQLFTGHDLDAVTGHYYAPFRYLNPSAGRWIKKEPLAMRFGPNMYAYVGDHPILYLDPSGLGWIGSRPLGDWRFKLGPLRHDQIFFGDPDGNRDGNIGFFKEDEDGNDVDGSVRPDNPQNLPRYDPWGNRRNLDDDRLRRAADTIGDLPQYGPGGYGLGRNDCQDFVQDVLDEYNRLEGLE